MKKIFIYVSVFSVLLAFGCGGNETDTEKLKEELKEELRDEMAQNESSDNQNNESSQNKEKAFQMKTYSPEMAKNLKYKGKIIRGEAWEDANGENLLIFTEKEVKHKGSSEYDPPSQSKYIYAYHFADKGDGYKEIRMIQDYTEKCDLALTAEFRFKTLNITDIDKDNKAEITFAYWLDCSGDLGHSTMKLMMLEDGEKYAIRGTTTISAGHYGPEDIPGEQNIDASFKNAPEGFLDFAKQIWDSGKYNPEK